MSCENHFHHQIALDVGNDLPQAELWAVERHLRSCQACRNLHDELLRSQAAVRRLALDGADASQFSRIRDRVNDRIGTQNRPAGQPWYSARWITATASLVLVLAVAGITGVWFADRESISEKTASRQSPVIPRIGVEVAETLQEQESQEHEAESAPPSAGVVAEQQPQNIGDLDRSTAKSISVHPPETRVEGATQQPIPATDSLIVRLVSESGDVVIYWQIDA